jgi:hypothetical protein
VAILTADPNLPFYGTITPVNIFRLLFNSNFEVELDQLDDKTFFASPTRPYDFIEITSQIETSDACFTGTNSAQ